MKTLETLADRLAAIVIGLIALLMVLSQFDVDIGPAIAGLGVVGIAVGFGAQTLVRDWLAGIFIVIENQYSVGDVVSIAGVDGVVEGFSLRRTVLRNLDGTVHNVPNGQIVVASNMTRGFARVNVDVSVAYDTDIDRASAVINRIGEEMQNDPAWADKIIEPPAVMRVNALGDSSVALKVLGQVKPAQQWAVSGELRKRVLAAFAAEGIEIPFPHQVLISRGQGSNGESRSRAETDQPASEG
jgi:small conductance mechanosensitive channel